MKKNILYLIMLITINSCSSFTNNIVTCPGAINIKERDTIKILYESLKFDKENGILTISGKIIDSESEKGLGGVNIILFPKQKNIEGVGTQNGGKFNLEIDTNKYDSFKISYLGYKSKTKYIKQIISENL